MSEIAPEEHSEEPLEEPPVLSEDPVLPEDLPEIPETPAPKTRAPRKKKAVVAQPPQPPPPQLAVDANFWSELLQTRREMDRVATRTRFANLVKM